MIRDSKFPRRKSGKNLNFEETENVPPPIDQELGFKSSKVFKTPEKQQGVLTRTRTNTPRKGLLEPISTPLKSVSKVCGGGSSRPPVNGGARVTALFKGVPVTSNTSTTLNTIEVPHIELKEDPSFWLDHNVQVLLRIRPLNNMEITSQGYNRCLKQESAQTLTWVGNPETRFTFDHVACETIDQETLFKMVGLPMVENCLSGYNSCMFAYGQTGSGKTHTMLGEINDLEVKPSPYRGMTPRIFEFLFARIFAEQENRKNERLTYNCKCSFLEIYNEHITDLLDPSSTNLQLREDVKNGVYVENLTEFEVHTVGDILKLLSQGAANRRVAVTNMNKESSRSHSVFTCVIESRWEKDSTSNLRFARLNLVDLAGSERQKSSGAEGERLKEAANINKSLSTLGHVIMVLVDGANTRTRHVPYRDSKLTFLLQDSLGGNSKTMIIANVSPSVSSATETLNTLKFAQRAKLIQNNAVINEDASGNVGALQYQIRLLKEELAILKRYNLPRSVTLNLKDENSSTASSIEMNLLKDDEKLLRVSFKQLKSLETSLNGALRREKSTEHCVKQLEAEIKQLNSLVRQWEDENRSTKMLLKFREDKIQRLESVLAGSIPMDSYLLEENNMLNEEIRIISSKANRNPQMTRFALENIRLSDQIRRFRDFYEEGEREILVTEVSDLKDQLVLLRDENSKNDNHMNLSEKKEAAEDKIENVSLQTELKKSQEELEKCRDNLTICLAKNAKLCREISDLNALLEMQKSAVNDHIDGIEEPILESSSTANKSSHTVQEKVEILKNDTEKVVDLQLEVEILNMILKEERSVHVETEEKLSLITKQYENVKEELREAKAIIEALEIQQIVTIQELEERGLKTISSKSLGNEDSFMQAKLKKMQDSLEKAKKLNMLYQTDRACNLSNEEEMDQVRKQVEAETSKVILCLQEDIGSVQLQMQESILKEIETQQELTLLREQCEEKDRHLNSLYEEFDLLTTKIEEVLTMGDKALDDASNLFGSGKRTLVSEQLQIIARRISEKELKIEELNSCLEDAKSRGNEMEAMLRSLRGATLVMSEAHQQNCNKKEEEIDYLLLELSENTSMINILEERIRLYEVELMNAKVNATEQSVEACCYLDKFEDTRDNIKEADFMINKLVLENEALKRKEVVFVNEKDMLEETLVMDMYAKEVELFIMLSKLEQVNNDHEKEKTSMSMVLDKFKEEIIISHVNLQLNDWISKEKDVEAKKVMESLDMELFEFKTVLEEKNTLIESLKDDLRTVTCENELYEVEITDAKRSATQNGVESCCYLDKLIETQHNGGMKIEIEELKRKEADISHHKQVINEKDDQLRCLEEKIMTDLSTKESELSIMSSKLEKVALQNTDCEKFKEDMIISYVDVQLKDCVFSEIDSEVKMAQGFAKAEELYEDELTDEKLNAAHQVIESFCFLDKFKEANDMMNELVTENEAMKIEIAEMKRKEGIFVNEMDMLNNISHQNQQMVHEKEEELRRLEDELSMVLFTKEIDLVIMLSKLEQVASQNICMSTVLDKFKEEITISYVDIQLRDSIFSEIDAEVEMVEAFIKENEANATKAKQLYELEFTDTKLTAAHREVESFYYLDRFNKAAFMINKLVTENEAMNTDIAEMKRKEDVFINEQDMLKENYSVLMKVKQQEINEKDEELRCLEQKLETDLYAKDKELFIVRSKLEQVALENNDFERENICMSRMLEKLKEEMVISYADMQFKDCILLEKDAEVGLLQKEELRHLKQNHLTELASKDIELAILSSKLEQMVTENNDHVKEKIMMSTVIEKLKEDVIISYVDMQVKDWILEETNAEVGFLQKEVKMQEEVLKNSSICCSALETSSSRLQHELETMSEELRLRKEENERVVDILKKDLKRVVCKRDELLGELLLANKEVEIAKALGDENGAIATKAKQARETIKLYADEKEKEVKLLEKSVEELKYTVHVLENQVDLMKRGAEKQRLQQEEQQKEYKALKSQNDELNDQLIMAEAIYTRVTKLRSANGRNSC